MVAEIINSATAEAMRSALNEFNTIISNINIDYWDYLSGKKFDVNTNPQPGYIKSRLAGCLKTMDVPKAFIDNIISDQNMVTSQIFGEYPRPYLDNFIDRACALLSFEQFKQIMQAIVDDTNKRLKPEVISVNPNTVEYPKIDTALTPSQVVDRMGDLMSQDSSFWREENHRNELAHLMAILPDETDFTKILNVLNVNPTQLLRDHFRDMDEASSMWKSLINFCCNTGILISQNADAQIGLIDGGPMPPSLIGTFMGYYFDKYPENTPNTDENADE